MNIAATRHVRLMTIVTASVCLVSLSHSYVAVRERWAERTVRELAALPGFRSVEPRLSFDLPHAPFRVSSASAMGLPALRRTNSELALNVMQLRSPRTRHAADLLLYDLNGAIDGLTRRIEQEPSADRWLDLAAAYYMRGLTARSLTDFARSLQCLGQAGPSPKATFNRALVLEQLKHNDAAAAEWRTYLASDGSSPWAAEARQHLQRLTAKRARTDIPSRPAIERELLPKWGEAFLRGNDADTREALAAARSATERWSRHSGDGYLAGLIAEIDAASRAKKTTLASAFAAYGRGRSAVLADPPAAHRELLRAKELFKRAGSAGELLVTSYLVTARYVAGDADGALRFAEEVSRCRTGCTAATGHTEWVRGMIQFQRGYPSTSLESFKRSLAIFEQLGERDQQASQHTNLADTYQYLGDAERAAVHRYQALVLAEEIEDPRRLQPILSEAADSAAAESLPEAALVFQDRVVRLARTSNDPFQLADALVVRGTLHQRAGRRAAALQDLEAARRVAPAIEDRAMRDKMVSDIAAATALTMREVDDARTIAELDRSITYVREQQSHIRLAQLLLERGRAHLRLGRSAEAERDFNAGIAELEDQRHRLGERDLRIAYFDQAEKLFSDLALLLLQRRRAGEAYEVLERSRARELLDAATGRTMQPMPLHELQRSLGPRVTVVTYIAAEDRVVAAVLTRDSLRFVQGHANAAELRGIVDRIGGAFSAQKPLGRQDLRRLHDTLIAPLRVSAGTRLIFVPDRFLYRVPFAALMNAHGDYLMQRHVISVAPSATLYVRNTARDRALAAASGAPSALVVASGERPEGFDSLPALRSTTAEARAIAAMYAGSRVAMTAAGGDVLAQGADTDVMHFATHAVINDKVPSDSMLLIGANTRLRVADIEAARLDRTRLVVLGACSSGIGKPLRGEGVLSLARAFMAAGVPSVIGTVAPVEDVASATLLTQFHAAYARGLDAPSALRHAQLAMLHHRNPSFADPARWSAFQVIGGASATPNQREEI
jgi:CHAT domain-containing protein